MRDLLELAVSSDDELMKKRRQLVEELAILDAVIEHVDRAHTGLSDHG